MILTPARRLVRSALPMSIVLAAGPAVADPPIDLADVAAGTGGFVINGIDANDQSGARVAVVGDVNGDGLDDVFVGVFRGDVGTNMDAGEAYVVFGKTDTAPVDLADLDAGTGGFPIRGIGTLEFLGIAVDDAGDVNGDGLDDVIVGAVQADNGPFINAGRSFVVFGKADTGPVFANVIATGVPSGGGFMINGIDSNDFSGRHVAGAGDVNGDGLDDVLVGSEEADPGGTFNAGETYVVFGKADATPVEASDIAAGIGGFVINGIDASDKSSSGIDGIGDMNGDGLADIIVGGFGADALAGEAYVVFGKADTTAVALADVAAGTGGFLIAGAATGDQFGRAAAGVGDVNGDGIPDVLIGAQQADPGAVNGAGAAWLVFGKADTAPVDLADIAAGTGGFVINGIDPLDFAGIAVAPAGDLDGDGLSDVLVGVPSDDFGGTQSGAAYLVYGKADTAPVELSVIAGGGSGGILLGGVDAFDQCGTSLGGGGDVNGDGRPDFAIGAFDADPGGNASAGETYVVFGPPPCAALDLDGSGAIGFADLSALLAAWGPCPGCPEDLDGNGVVGFADLDMLLALWGPCP